MTKVELKTTYGLTSEAVLDVLAKRFKSLGCSILGTQLLLAGRYSLDLYTNELTVTVSCSCQRSDWLKYLTNTAGKALLAAFGGRLCTTGRT
jgi:hypothetical protein